MKTRTIIASCVIVNDVMVLNGIKCDVKLSQGNDMGGWTIHFEAYSPVRNYPFAGVLVLAPDFPVTIKK